MDILTDITNTGYLNRKRLSNGEVKSYKYVRKPRKTIDCNFENDAHKLAFDEKYECMKKHLEIKSNTDLINTLLDFYIKKTKSIEFEKVNHSTNDEQDELDLFVCSKQKLFQLVRLSQWFGPLEPTEMTKIGHVAKLVVKPLKTECFPIFWHSSSALKQDFTINYKLIHSYLCAGMYPAQYERFSNFANIGLPAKRFREKMFPTYRNAVISLRDYSINSAITEERQENSYDDGEIDIMTDARHACRKNSFHTDVTALGNCTHKVVGYSHVTKQQERSSQKHETFGTQKLYQEFQRTNVTVKVHSHDRNASVSKYLTQNQPNVTDSYDTWHGAKEVRRTMSKITKGTRKNIDKTWHPELRDKSAGVKTHVYWAMRNCNGNANQLVLSLDTIVEHYKQNHRNCHPTSRCHQNNYVPSRDIIRNPIAEQLLRNSIRSLYIYKHPEKYTHCRDTHYIESYHNTILIYLDKRLHFHDLMYDIKLGIAILDWNEHVDRPASSVQYRVQHDHPRRQSGYRVLTPKQYTFVDQIWNRFVNFLCNGQIMPDPVEGDDIENVQVDQDDTVIDSEHDDSDDDD